MKRLLFAALFTLGLLAPAFAASTPDPCVSINSKNSVAISVSSATTTQLVALTAGHGIFVCGFTMTIAGSATTAATAQLEYAPNASCASSTTALTGTFGSNDAAVSTTPTQVSYGNGGATVLFVPPGNALCIVTAGNAVLTSGAVTYVQGSGNNFP